MGFAGRIVGWSALAAVASCARGPAPATAPDARGSRPAPSAEAYTTALAAGRAQEDRGKHAAAVRDLELAVSARPDDPVALTELGWASLHAGDLDRAESATRKAIAFATDDELHAQGLYNLGRIAEARGDRELAIDSYARSLRLRPNARVLAHLATLDPAAVAEFESVFARPLVGPCPSLPACCARIAPDAAGPACRPADPGRAPFADGAAPLALAAPPGPYRAVELLTVVHGQGAGARAGAGLAAQTAAGWFVADLPAPYGDDLAVTRFAPSAAAFAGAPILSLVLRGERRSDGAVVDARDFLYLVGVGASAAPSLTTPLLVAASHRGDALEQVALAWSLAPDATLTVQGGPMLLDRDVGGEIGRHLVVFP